jgi:predicted DsbA family dithiol-disulfide isomerase
MLVEIWSDIACPWCYVGKRRLEAALERFEHRDEVEILWRSFELDPQAPAERTGEYGGHLAAKYGTTPERAQEMLDTMTETAARDGLEFRFDRVRAGSTFDAHRLVHLAHALGRQDAMKERLMRGYLEEGELMSDHEALTRLAVEAGLDEAEARATLATDRFADEVRGDETLAAQLGITAVPFFVVDRAIALSGAHEPALLLKLLTKAHEASRTVPVLADGAACGPDGC